MHNTCSTSCGRFAIGVQVVATPSVRFWAEIQVAIRVIQTAQRCVLTRSCPNTVKTLSLYQGIFLSSVCSEKAIVVFQLLV